MVALLSYKNSVQQMWENSQYDTNIKGIGLKHREGIPDANVNLAFMNFNALGYSIYQGDLIISGSFNLGAIPPNSQLLFSVPYTFDFGIGDNSSASRIVTHCETTYPPGLGEPALTNFFALSDGDIYYGMGNPTFTTFVTILFYMRVIIRGTKTAHVFQ